MRMPFWRVRSATRARRGVEVEVPEEDRAFSRAVPPLGEEGDVVAWVAAAVVVEQDS